MYGRRVEETFASMSSDVEALLFHIRELRERRKQAFDAFIEGKYKKTKKTAGGKKKEAGTTKKGKKRLTKKQQLALEIEQKLQAGEVSF